MALAIDPADAAALDRLILTIAGEYRAWGRASDAAMWAPEMCRLIPSSSPLVSASTHEATHGRKLYYVYTADAGDYFNIGLWSRDRRAGATGRAWLNPIGQVVVKEAFTPRRVDATTGENGPTPAGVPAPHGEAGTERFAPGEPAGLFVMVKLDPARAGTDAGWVYATTTPDASRVLQAGVIDSCVRCHEETTRDRLYGPIWSWPTAADPASAYTPSDSTVGRRPPTRQTAPWELAEPPASGQ